MKKAFTGFFCGFIILFSGACREATVSSPKVPPRSPSPEKVELSGGRITEKPPAGLVPDAETAIAIAVAVWTPLYGKKTIEGQKPYIATLRNGVWIVSGTLPEGFVGGTAVAEISKDSGCLLRVVHFQ